MDCVWSSLLFKVPLEDLSPKTLFLSTFEFVYSLLSGIIFFMSQIAMCRPQNFAFDKIPQYLNVKLKYNIVSYSSSEVLRWSTLKQIEFIIIGSIERYDFPTAMISFQ